MWLKKNRLMGRVLAWRKLEGGGVPENRAVAVPYLHGYAAL